jgi:NADH dehydrogenase (ubiquinone) flavoprotein 2
MSSTQSGFEFPQSLRPQADKIIAKYPQGRQASAVLPLLDLVQRQNGGWITTEMVTAVAEYLEMAPIRVYEVATFYTMINLEPVGDTVVEVCTTTPCWLRGCDGIVQACEETLGIKLGESTEDGRFTLREVECLGACVNAPIVRIGDDYYEDLDPDRTRAILNSISRGAAPPPGSQTGRKTSAPASGPTTLSASGGDT